MKRYFTFLTPPDPAVYNPHGQYHYMSLPGAGYVCVLEEESSNPPDDWQELPHLLESTAANFNGISHVFGAASSLSATFQAHPPIGGVLPTDTTFQVAKKLAAINKHFHP